MVIQNTPKGDNLRRLDLTMSENERISSYEKKYYALRRRIENISLSNERLVNRIHHVKRLIKRRHKERQFLMNKLDAYGDDYRSVFRSLVAEAAGDSPNDSSSEAPPAEPKADVPP